MAFLDSIFQCLFDIIKGRIKISRGADILREHFLDMYSADIMIEGPSGFFAGPVMNKCNLQMLWRAGDQLEYGTFLLLKWIHLNFGRFFLQCKQEFIFTFLHLLLQFIQTDGKVLIIIIDGDESQKSVADPCVMLSAETFDILIPKPAKEG